MKGTRIDIDSEVFRSLGKTREEREAALELKLRRMKEQGEGEFDTGLACVCGKPIIDHAQHRPFRQNPPVFGPPKPIEDRVHQFPHFIRHEYNCEDCGIMYAKHVIEGKRGYVPREKRDGFGE